MKRVVVILILLLPSLVMAAPILDFQHNQTQSGETILAKITIAGEFTKSIEASDITFYEGRKQVPFESDIAFYNGTYYLYIYAAREGLFSVQIADILYKEGDNLGSVTIVKPFNVSDDIIMDEGTNESYKEILSIKPGFIFSAKIPKIKLINMGTTILNLTYGENKTSLKPMETKEILLNPTEIFSYFNISSYKDFSVPIIYLAATKNETFESSVTQLNLKHDPELLLAELFTNNKTQKIIQLFNFGDSNITDTKLTTDISFAEVGKLDDMPGKGKQNLTVKFDADMPGHFQGHINITYTQSGEQNKLSIPVSLFVLPEGSSAENFEASEETCDSISGTVCKEKELCTAEATFTKRGEYCCLGTCEPIEEELENGGYGWLIGLIIILAIGMVGYYLYNKQRKFGSNKPGEQLKEISEKFDKRMSGVSSSRISGELTKS
ncbi:MAG: hypothetical protein OEL87_03935, partial [Nanoarchaeota archaeon]|nr:hypothetical protein [Nanoarchaeota archaeon]